jgi:toxin YoeB
MEVIYTTHAQEDRDYWELKNPELIKRIDKLIKDIQKHPFKGIGKPEPLKFEKAGYWSRRITREHRLVYKIANSKIYIAQCRYHY